MTLPDAPTRHSTDATPDDPRFVRCVSQAADIDVRWPLDGDAQPKITAGWPGWDEEPRARRRALIVWSGPPAIRLDIPIMLDAYLDSQITRAQAAARRDHGQPVGAISSAAEALVATRFRAMTLLATPQSATGPPPTCQLFGLALPPLPQVSPGNTWALTAIDQGSFLRNVDDGSLLRWQGTLSFAQIVDRDVLEIAGLSSPPSGKTQTYKWKTGDTLQRVAAKLLGKASRWQEITFADGSKIRGSKDPKLKAGVVVRMPAR